MSSEETTPRSFREMADSITGDDFASRLARQSALAASAKFDPPGQGATVPPGPYAQGQRSPIAWVLLCSVCAGFAPTTPEDYRGALSGQCAGCGTHVRELHRFRAWIDSATGCQCRSSHDRVVGDVDVDEAALAGRVVVDLPEPDEIRRERLTGPEAIFRVGGWLVRASGIDDEPAVTLEKCYLGGGLGFPAERARSIAAAILAAADAAERLSGEVPSVSEDTADLMGDFHAGDMVRNRRTGAQMIVHPDGGSWSAYYYSLVTCPHLSVPGSSGEVQG